MKKRICYYSSQSSLWAFKQIVASTNETYQYSIPKVVFLKCLTKKTKAGSFCTPLYNAM